ncbi:cell division cycle- protein [Phytophthora pseudosyringae]|uniref:Cell division cycle- protein n=1 Tax=Phytophthora pseudosyringae TaxID=221518 RepID=A0A8T1VEV9_9STRA|nr:cell division cycle- protein [Phytophthora pseudosyringae]
MDGDRPRRSHLTPLISTQLQLSTPPSSPSTRQSTVQNSERPSKRVGGRSRRPEGVSAHSRRRRAIFDVEKEQDRKRAASAPDADEAELSPRSTLTQQQLHTKKSKRGLVEPRAESVKSAMPVKNDSVPVKKAAAPPSAPILPTVYSSKHPDLNVITPGTVAQLLRGEFDEHLAGFELLDCRFPFEFGGGSLIGATSLCDPDKMEAQFFVSTMLEHSTRRALVFFCEFSANRAPKMLRHVRNVDRKLHADSYPELYYPELYLVDGGYKNCFETRQLELCSPSALYVTMDDERFGDECRHEFAAWRRRWRPHKNVANCAKTPEKLPRGSGRSHREVRVNVTAGVRSLFDEL